MLSRRRTSALLIGYAGAALTLACTWVLMQAVDRGFRYFAREPAAALKEEDCSGFDCAAAGFLSNVGVITWGSGALLTLAAAWLLTGRPGASEACMVLVLAGGVTALLALDDMFLVHDYVVARFVGEHAGQLLCYAVYAALGVFMLVRLRRLAETNTEPLFVLGGALLVVSAALDLLFEESYVVEDSLKLFGIVTWTAALAFTMADLLRRHAPEVLPPGVRTAS
jgi:hypothetical protein